VPRHAVVAGEFAQGELGCVQSSSPKKIARPVNDDDVIFAQSPEYDKMYISIATAIMSRFLPHKTTSSCGFIKNRTHQEMSS